MKEVNGINFYKNKSALLSTLFMGLGQLYNRQYIKGIFLALIELLFLICVIPYLYQGIPEFVTLGDKPQSIVNGRIYPGDHSLFLMMKGVIALLVIIAFIIIYLANIYDAKKTGELRYKGKAVNNIKQSFRALRNNGLPYLMLAPTYILVLVFIALPIIFGVLIAFTNYSGPKHIPPRSLVDWTGIDSFLNLFRMSIWNKTFIGVGSWTIIWAIIATFSTYFLGLIIAVLINKKGIEIKKFWRMVYIIPWAVPSFISFLALRMIFNEEFGQINAMLQLIEIQPIPWLTDTTWARITCFIANLWFGFPYNMALMSGVVTSIPNDYYEVADLEGANSIYKFRKITLPMVLYSTAPLLIMSFANNLNNFGIVYFITDGGPANISYNCAGDTDLLITWIFKLAFSTSKYNMAAAISILYFILIATLSIWNFRRTRSFKEEDMIK